MIEIRSILVLLSLLSVIECKMEPYVVGGKRAKIKKFPHSVFINVICLNKGGEYVPWTCGGSIVNDKILLTAAHCLEDCTGQSQLFASVGHSHTDQGAVSTVHSFYTHSRYKPSSTGYDIGLIRLSTPLTFSNNVQRLALMKNPPYYEKAQIAGWGLIDEVEETKPTALHYTDQSVMQQRKCQRTVPGLPAGAICATSAKSESYPARGDSGSALVVRGYIQIGIVSYKLPKVSRSLVVYTDTGYFYDWIKKNSRRLYCV